MAGIDRAPAGAQLSPGGPIQRSQPLLGTFVTITVFGKDPGYSHTAISAAFDEVRRVDQLLSNHKIGNEADLMNLGAARAPHPISDEMHFVIATAWQIAERTGGAFDPTIGPLTRAWGFIRKEHRLPTTEELERLLPLISYEQVGLTTNNSPAPHYFIRFQRPGMFIDFGGIGKGHAVDRAMEILRKHGIRSAMVKAGGDLRVIGTPPGEDAWTVQIEDPAKEGRRTSIRIRDRALSTSGNYENYFEVDGRRYSHILDPRTGMPAQGIASCTVIAPTCIESDAYATAFFVLGIERALRDFGDEFGIRFVDTTMKETRSEKFVEWTE